MLAQDKLLADALDSLESANDVLRRYEDRLFWLEKEESLRRDGTFKHLELRRRVLTSKADVFESAGSLEEAITTLHELCKLQAEEMAPEARRPSPRRPRRTRSCGAAPAAVSVRARRGR